MEIVIITPSIDLFYFKICSEIADEIIMFI
jgi:hypothetical protein